jgi:hypothetical protein
MEIMNRFRLKITAISVLTLSALAVGFTLWLIKTRPAAKSNDTKPVVSVPNQQVQNDVNRALNVAHYERTSQEEAPVVPAEELSIQPPQPTPSNCRCRHLELENGRWLNAGNDRFASIGQARAQFSKFIQGE